jgi:hypothetical protein
MATLTVAPSPNGTKPQAPAPIVPLIGAQVDRLAELRATLRTLEAEERALTAEISGALQTAGVVTAQGRHAIARIETRTIQKVDPELFLELVGHQGLQAMSVSITAARKLAVAADLDAISEKTEQRALRVDTLPPAPARLVKVA